MTERPSGMPRFSYGRRVRNTVLVTVLGAAVALAPWTGYLAASLPDRFDTHQWRAAWVGFDVGLLGCFAAAGWLGWRRHRAAGAALVATATLMCADAWFDVVLDWNGSGRWTSVVLALAVELPGALLLLRQTRPLLVGGIRTRVVDPREIVEVLTDPTFERVVTRLDEVGTATAVDLAGALDLPVVSVRAALATLAATGHVRPQRGGRWRSAAQSLHWPDPRDVPAPYRERYREFIDAKYDRELRLLTRAAREHERLGDWGKASRGSAHLTRAELARFNDEYHELLFRYSMLHERPAEGTREIALRFYAFPGSLAEEPVVGTDR